GRGGGGHPPDGGAPPRRGRPADRRPVRPQPLPRYRDPDREGPGRSRGRGHGRAAPPREPDDRGGGRRPRARGRQGGRLRGQGDQRDRRDPVREGTTGMTRAHVALAAPLLVATAACSSAPRPTGSPATAAPTD